MDAAACIGCGACVAACKNASAMLFVGAKVSHLTLLAPGEGRSRWNGLTKWWPKWMNWALETAPIQEPVKLNVPKGINADQYCTG